MNNQIEKVIDAFAAEIYTLAQKVFESYSLEKSSLAQDFEKPKVSLKGDSIVVEILFNNYIEYLERGRSPKSGKQPPVSALVDWAKQKGIPADNSTLYLIARAIWRDGHQGRPILATLENEITNAFENKWADKLYEAITEELTKYFN